MADWRNRMDQIVNKVKAQLFAKGVDNMQQLKDVFLVSHSLPRTLTVNLETGSGPDSDLRVISFAWHRFLSTQFVCLLPLFFCATNPHDFKSLP